MDVPVEELRRRYIYDPETGFVTMRIQLSSRVRAGERAGSVNGPVGYRYLGVGKRKYFEHRVIWAWMTGAWPAPGLTVDHKNGIYADNRWVNLRLATLSQQQQNRKACRRSPSGRVGVCWDKRAQSWYAEARNHKLQKYGTLLDCVAARIGFERAFNTHHREET